MFVGITSVTLSTGAVGMAVRFTVGFGVQKVWGKVAEPMKVSKLKTLREFKTLVGLFLG